MKLIKDNWNKIRSGSKIYLKRDMILKSFNKETEKLKKGYYYISGFWVDICGLSTTRENCYKTFNEFYINSIELRKFYV